MSRDWHEHKYCSVENLWHWVDQQVEQIESALDEAKHAQCESYKMTLFARKEMVSKIADWIIENETTLGSLAERWGLREKEEG